MKLAPYPSYKPSGVEWLGEVPEHWEVKRLKYTASINDEALPETTDPTFELIYVDIGSVDAIRGITHRQEMVFEDAPSRARRIVRDGDTIVSTVRTYLRAIAPIRDPEPNTIVSTGFAVVRPRKLTSVFMSYALREPGLVDAIVARSVGVSYPAVNASEIGTLPIPLPAHDEQRAIADFLDRETAKIDTLVARKRTLIERLKEKRTALISRTVTRGLPPDAATHAGLDPDPNLKPSGIDWLGEVPEHWDTGHLRRFALLRTGHTPTRSEPGYWEECEIPWFTLADVWQLRDGRRIYLGETKERISQVGLANSSAELLPAGTVVLSRTASVGFSGIMPVQMATSQDFWNWVPGPNLIPEYLVLLFRSMRQEFLKLTMGSTHKTIYQPDAARLCICVPPLD
ncbi:MAG: restriction endonuclease subunit S, partial [Gemmatimonadota bacterium]